MTVRFPLRLLFAALAVLAAQVAQGAPAVALGYTPKYPQGFSHFDYVNRDAPKGGELTLPAIGSFDSLNPFVLKSSAAEGVSSLVFETLMEQSWDEPYSQYGLLAEDEELAEDRLSVTFRLNPAARFSDGSPVTAEDVATSYRALTGEGAHPFYRFYWADVDGVEVVDGRTVRFRFKKVNPELHLIIGQLPVLSAKWLNGRKLDQVVLERPVGSGPYGVEDFQLGKYIRFKRNPDYWARDLGVREGMYNFERVTFTYYKDATVELEGFKAGEFDAVAVFNSKQWARDYVGERFDSGLIKKVELAHRNNAGMQAFVFNLRRPLFQDKRVRKAISLAYDFEWANDNLFYDQYRRCDSYFSNSELAAQGLPSPGELTLLEPFRDRLPPEVFTEAWRPPTTAPPHSLRDNLREAKRLLNAAGWRVEDGVLQNAEGRRFEFEVMLSQKGFERIMAPFARNLEKLGIKVDYRTVDQALYQRRAETFDFDMIVWVFGQSQSPGNEQYNMWHSRTAGQEGSNNVIGLKDPVIDALVDKIVYAPDRAALVTAARALDRVLLNGEYVVPNWYIPYHRVAYWDKFAYPAQLPLYYQATAWVLATWWAKDLPAR